MENVNSIQRTIHEQGQFKTGLFLQNLRLISHHCITSTPLISMALNQHKTGVIPRMNQSLYGLNCTAGEYCYKPETD